MKQHQISHATTYNRYPEIFKVCSDYFFKKNMNILSFGCSDGSEVKTLKELYFPTARIHGVDISKELIEKCNEENGYKDVKYTLSEELDKSCENSFNLIFCMSVLCRWPQTENLKNCSKEYSFEEYEKQIKSLYDYLKTGGFLVIYNSNFCFFESEIYSKFTPITSELIKDNGFVHKFNSKNEKINISYKDCIFLKK